MQTLRQAILAIETNDTHEARFCGLTGCPAGGWPETKQAVARLSDAMPNDRAYTIAELIDCLYTLDHAERYVPRDRPILTPPQRGRPRRGIDA